MLHVLTGSDGGLADLGLEFLQHWQLWVWLTARLRTVEVEFDLEVKWVCCKGS
jgi:hypothetical protein